MSSRWSKAQEEELLCWESNKEKINSPEYLELKTEYWNRLLERLDEETLNLVNGKILDFGCGPSGLSLSFPEKSDLYAADPLMDAYIEGFPHLQKTRNQLVSQKIENLQEAGFDLVFGFNSLDHVDDIEDALAALTNITKKDGRIVLSMNVHTDKLYRSILQATNRIFDPLHPYQYTIDEYRNIIESNGLNVEATINIDNEVRWINDRTKNKSLSWKGRIAQVLHPSLPWKLLGYNMHGPEHERKKLYTHAMLVCRPT